MTTKITLVGSTGLTGSQTLRHLLQSKNPLWEITTLTRKPLSNPLPTSKSGYINKVYSDLTNAVKEPLGVEGGIYISCLGSTISAEGGIEGQRKIDVNLNKDLAKCAKRDGVQTMILVSSAGASSSSLLPYTKMKGELEDGIISLGFRRTIILRPGLLLGTRSKPRYRPDEIILQSLFKGLRFFGIPITYLAVDAVDVGACIAQLAAYPPVEGVTYLNDHEIVKYAQAFRAANT